MGDISFLDSYFTDRGHGDHVSFFLLPQLDKQKTG